MAAAATATASGKPDYSSIPSSLDSLEATKALCRDLLLRNCGDETTADGTAWRRDHDKDGIRVFSSEVPGVGNRRFKACCRVPFSTKVILAHGIDRVQRVKWDDSLHDMYVLRGLGKDTDLIRIATKGMLTISSRDFTDISVVEELEDGTILAYGQSVALEEHPEESGFVRAWNLPGCGWRIRPVDVAGKPHADIDYVILSDLKGWLPSWTINSAMVATYTQFFERMVKHLNDVVTAEHKDG